MQKLYCYVDESGQDTQGELFIVGVVIVGDERDDMEKILELVEDKTGKSKTKWAKTEFPKRLAYMQRVTELKLFHGKLYFAKYERLNLPHIELVARGIAEAWARHTNGEALAFVQIDGLPESQIPNVMRLVRDLGMTTKKVRGIRKDENSALIRLADALCGFARAAHEQQPLMVALFKKTLKTGAIQDARQQKTHLAKS